MYVPMTAGRKGDMVHACRWRPCHSSPAGTHGMSGTSRLPAPPCPLTPQPPGPVTVPPPPSPPPTPPAKSPAAAARSSLFCARTRGLRAGGGDVLRHLRARDDDLGLAHVVVGQEDHLQGGRGQGWGPPGSAPALLHLGWLALCVEGRRTGTHKGCRGHVGCMAAALAPRRA
jgi:hypothetical protein